MDKILSLLEENALLTAENIAAMLGEPAENVKAAIDKYEKDGVILGYRTLVDWNKTDRDAVTALIEVRVSPSKGEGFDSVAEKIVNHEEVKSVILMSGAYDLLVTVEGKSLKEVALFVSEKLSSLESVLSTATHFMLKKYKYEGIVFSEERRDERGLHDGL